MAWSFQARIQLQLEAEGDRGVVHRLRGRASNHKSRETYRQQVIAAYEADDSDFGPTLAVEKQAERGPTAPTETMSAPI